MKFVDFFAGIGGMRSGLEKAGHECVGFCEWDKYARQSYKAIYDTEGEWENHDVRTVNSTDIPRADIWTFGFPCFVADTLILTDKGYTPIQQVKAGDLVLTHKGNWKPVTKVMSRDNAELWEVSGENIKTTYTTAEHPYYVMRDGEYDFIHCKDLDDTDFSTMIVTRKCGNNAVQFVKNFTNIDKGENNDRSYWIIRGRINRPVNTYERARVYNISVQEDESYIANGAIVHNCQDISIAGKQKGLQGGERSGLFYEIMRLLAGLREEDKPEWIIAENVKNLLSIGNGFDFLRCITEMGAVGYTVEWQLFNTKYSYVSDGQYIPGIPQNRERIYIVGHLASRGQRKILPVARANEKNNTELKQVGRQPSESRDNPNQGRVYGTDGIAPALNCKDRRDLQYFNIRSKG